MAFMTDNFKRQRHTDENCMYIFDSEKENAKHIHTRLAVNCFIKSNGFIHYIYLIQNGPWAI